MEISYPLLKIFLLSLSLLGIRGINYASVAQIPSLPQNNLASCTLPGNQEYLLLVITPNREERAAILQNIPNDMEVSFCNYSGEAVTRIGSFGSLEAADEWGQYFQQNLGLTPVIIEGNQTPLLEVVSEPPPITTQEPPSIPETSSEVSPLVTQEPPSISETLPQASSNSGYNPQPLGTGYAILIDYLNQPEIASQLQQILNREIGLASYLARPYLIAIHTSDENEANTVFKNLSDHGFWTIMVDSNKVTLLTPVVK